MKLSDIEFFKLTEKLKNAKISNKSRNQRNKLEQNLSIFQLCLSEFTSKI